MRWVSLFVAIFVLNSALSFHNLWPTPWITLWPEVSVEACALILAIAAFRRVVGRPSRALLIAVAVALFFMVLGRYVEVTAPALYGRAINLYWDARYVPDVVAMLADAVSPVMLAATFIGVLVAIALVCALLYWAVGNIARALESRPTSVYLPVISALLVAAYFLGYHRVLPTLRAFSIPVTQTYARQLEFVLDAVGGRALAALPVASPLESLNVEMVGRRDMLVTFVESYGATAFDVPSVAMATEEGREHLARAVTDTGREVVSAFIESPTFGGGSWLAHISFMTGIRVTDNATYNALLTQSRLTVPKLFRAGGYRAVAVMPGLKNQWPEGTFYGFDDIYGEAALDYLGPEFGWWRIPDQYSLARIRALELDTPNRAPVFVFFPTISTHAPFRPTPPYQPDWKRLMGPTPFSADALTGSLEFPQGFSEYRAAYGDALAYTYEYWAGYLQNNAADDAILVILGDHQPPATVSGEGVRWDIPVHVITRSADLASSLRARGFVSGLVPNTNAIAQMHELAPMLIR
jgi:hypothetical protein